MHYPGRRTGCMRPRWRRFTESLVMFGRAARSSPFLEEQPDNEQSAMLKIGVLASHEGTTLQCILDACEAGRIQGKVVVVISNNGNSCALSRAKAAGIPARHLSSITHPTPETLDAAISAALSAGQVDIVFLAGYLKRLGPATLAAFR